MKLFDAHCHLQDARILNFAPQLISTALDSGVRHFAVNGVSEKDWHLVKDLGEQFPCVIPSFGLHPWYVSERSPHWFDTLKNFVENNPTAAVGEIGLDKGSRGLKTDFNDQVTVLLQQLELAKSIGVPASIHCVRAYGDLLGIMRSAGPFSSGFILHSYLGSAEMVTDFAKLGAYFSFSGFIMSMSQKKAKKMLKAVPFDKILLETDAPDALPRAGLSSLYIVDQDPSIRKEIHIIEGSLSTSIAPSSENRSSTSAETMNLPKDTLNHPANIHSVLDYIASLLEIPKEELADRSYRNAVHLFSYKGSKLLYER